ncbi:MAG: Mur ligase family protein [Desulfuromonadales bacterium]
MADYFLRRGAEVVLSDTRPPEVIPAMDSLPQAHLRLDLGGHSPEIFRSADLVVLSPGVALTVPAVAAALDARVPVVGEVEIAWRELSAPLVAIAGTNGKSTTTTLLGKIFEAWGKKTFVGGNLGLPLVEATREEGWDWVMAEVSSFQLEAIREFRPRYALLLNITEDHLDRYPDMEAYVAAKCRVFENMDASDVAVLNAEDSRVLAAAGTVRARRVFFSSARILDEGMGLDGADIVWRWEGTEFTGLDHRMVPVRTLDGVTWYNDSKGTNVGSVVKSLAGLAAPVTLIAGGKDKGGDYAPLADLVRSRVAHLILIGQAAGRMAQALGDLTHTLRAASLEEAVRLARELTPAGGSVLLSPGCSSFDMFKSFEDRGEVFTRAVLALPDREAV